MIRSVLSWVMGKAGFTAMGATGWWLAGAVAVAIAGGGVWSGYWLADTKHKATQMGIYQDWEESLIILDKDHRARERELIAKQAENHVQIRTVIKEIPKYITPDGCTINDDGVQHLRDQVGQLFPYAKRSAFITRDSPPGTGQWFSWGGGQGVYGNGAPLPLERRF